MQGRQQRRSPRTMILLDPDLDPDPTPASSAAKKSPAPSKSNSLNLRVPSARTLARFLILAQNTVRLRGQVTVLLTTDAAMRDLNLRFRRKNKPTDVLSFPSANPVATRTAGDLAISVDTARRQAAEQHHPLATEIKVLILHGLLHLAGYDHESDAGQMHRRERTLRAKLGLPQGLIERASTRPAPKVRRTAGVRPPASDERTERRVPLVSNLRPGKSRTRTAARKKP